jgi:transcription elongation factor Elf1
MEVPMNRMEQPRKRGRPSNADLAARAGETQESDALPVVLDRHVPPLNCPKCGRGMDPRVTKWHNGAAYCQCRLCGGHFQYTPPKVRTL